MFKCTHCKKSIEDTGQYYPIGEVFVRMKLPYVIGTSHRAKGLCQECQAAAANEVQAVIEKYQKEKSPE